MILRPWMWESLLSRLMRNCYPGPLKNTGDKTQFALRKVNLAKLCELLEVVGG